MIILNFSNKWIDLGTDIHIRPFLLKYVKHMS